MTTSTKTLPHNPQATNHAFDPTTNTMDQSNNILQTHHLVLLSTSIINILNTIPTIYPTPKNIHQHIHHPTAHRRPPCVPSAAPRACGAVAPRPRGAAGGAPRAAWRCGSKAPRAARGERPWNGTWEVLEKRGSKVSKVVLEWNGKLVECGW